MPPAIAPSVVMISSDIPRRRLVMPFVTKTVCAAVEVAITQIRLVAMATFIGTSNTSVRMGTTTMPPPTPTMLPATPAKTAMAKRAANVMAAYYTARPQSSPAGGRRRRLVARAARLSLEAPLDRRARRLRRRARRRRRRVQLLEPPAQPPQALGLVLVLAAPRPAGHHHAAGPVPQAHRAVGDVLVLPAGPAGAKGLDVAGGEQVGVALGDLEGRARGRAGRRQVHRAPFRGRTRTAFTVALRRCPSPRAPPGGRAPRDGRRRRA